MGELIRELSKSSLFTIGDTKILAEEHSETLVSAEITRLADAASAANTTELLDKIIDGKYRILKLIGSGGMGCVYLARHLLLDKQIALKTFKSSSLDKEQTLRFQREAQAIAKLAHPNIVQVFDFGYAIDSSIPYYTMECLVGKSLGDKLAETKSLSEEEALPIFIQVCDGLSAAHRKGIIHRDLKPDNIFLESALTKTGHPTVKIVDFGIAALTQEKLDTQKLTAVGTVFGSPLYMSPEQSLGQFVSERSDIYSCGCALFQALTGKPPFLGANAFSTLLLHQSAPVPTLKEATAGGVFTPALEKLISIMLAKNPADRFESAEKVAEQLRSICWPQASANRPITNPGKSSNAVNKSSSLADESDDNDDDYEDEDDYEDGDGQEDSLANAGKSKQEGKRSNLFVAGIAGSAAIAVLASLTALYQHWHNQLQEKPQAKAISLATEEELQAKSNFGANSYSANPQQNTISEFPEPKDLARRLVKPTADLQFTLDKAYISKASLELIANTRWIRGLFMRNGEIDNANLDKLSKLNLISINLASSNFDDTGAEKLAQCKQLEGATLRFTSITDKGLSKLSALKELNYLDLSGTQVTEKALPILTKFKRLDYLDLSTLPISNGSLAVLIEIPLHSLNIESTDIDDGAIGYLLKMAKLKFLKLNKTNVTINGIRDLCKNSKQLQSIELNNCPQITAQQAKQLGKEFSLPKLICQEKKNPLAD